MPVSALPVNTILTGYFAARGIEPADLKREYGPNRDGRLIPGDGISPDTCRFRDLATGDRLDKDRCRRAPADVEGACREV